MTIGIETDMTYVFKEIEAYVMRYGKLGGNRCVNVDLLFAFPQALRFRDIMLRLKADDGGSGVWYPKHVRVTDSQTWNMILAVPRIEMFVRKRNTYVLFWRMREIAKPESSVRLDEPAAASRYILKEFYTRWIQEANQQY